MDKLKLTELKQEAKIRGISGFYKMKRSELIDILSLPDLELVYEKDPIQEYLDTLMSIPIPDALVDKMTRSKLQKLEKNSGTKVELFKSILRKEVISLLMIV